jgi:hypothetical protein
VYYIMFLLWILQSTVSCRLTSIINIKLACVSYLKFVIVELVFRFIGVCIFIIDEIVRCFRNLKPKNVTSMN